MIVDTHRGRHTSPRVPSGRLWTLGFEPRTLQSPLQARPSCPYVIKTPVMPMYESWETTAPLKNGWTVDPFPLNQADVSADAQELHGEEPEKAPQKPGAGGGPEWGGQVWLLSPDLWAARRVSPVCGGVQTQRRQHLDHEAGELRYRLTLCTALLSSIRAPLCIHIHTHTHAHARTHAHAHAHTAICNSFVAMVMRC